ncbi:MAG: prealbumin-like fold domain-containing protein, partial [Bacilli bacterium]
IEYERFTTIANMAIQYRIEVGKYRVSEIKAPDGYFKSSNKFEFEVGEDDHNKLVTVTYPNVAKPLPKTGNCAN